MYKNQELILKEFILNLYLFPNLLFQPHQLTLEAVESITQLFMNQQPVEVELKPLRLKLFQQAMELKPSLISSQAVDQLLNLLKIPTHLLHPVETLLHITQLLIQMERLHHQLIKQLQTQKVKQSHTSTPQTLMEELQI